MTTTEFAKRELMRSMANLARANKKQNVCQVEVEALQEKTKHWKVIFEALKEKVG